MAAEGKVSAFLCLITFSRVLFKFSRCAAAFNFRNGAKETSSGCFEGGKTVFGTVLRFCEQERTSNVLSVTSSCFVVSARIVPPPARRVNLLGKGKIQYQKLHFFFYKNIFYKTIEAEIWKIVRI